MATCPPNGLLPCANGHVSRHAYFSLYEVITNHWDGACLTPLNNNHHVVFDKRRETFMYAPWGLDQTFQGCAAWMQYQTHEYSPECPPMVECFENETCEQDYRHVRYAASPHRHTYDCGEQILFATLLTLGQCFVAACAIALLLTMLKYVS